MIRSDAEFRHAQTRRGLLAAALEDDRQRDRLSLNERVSIEAQVDQVDCEIRTYVHAVATVWLS